MGVIKVKAMQHTGDWFLIPNELTDEFERLTEKFNSNNYPERYDDEEEFEEKFREFETGGDLNNIQLYVTEKQ